MKLTIVGGGGFRVPLVYEAVAADDAPTRITELCLYDVSQSHLDTIRDVIEELAPQYPHAPRVTVTTELTEAIRGASFIFSAVRIGGTAGRIVDERVALDLGVLGQETIGAGGLSYALRTIPFMLDLARTIRDLAPDAWVINFTNPAGMVTEAMRAVLGDRVVGICDTPIGLMRRAVAAAGVSAAEVSFDYVGLNHLGWLRAITTADGTDLLPSVLASDAALETIEEARLMGFDWVRSIGALPNEYLYYYSFTREAVQKIRSADQTRGEFLAAQQGAFFGEETDAPLQRWQATLDSREATYMAESRDDGESRHAEDVGVGGYQQVALDIMAAIHRGREATMILNVRNGGLVPQLPEDAVVEVGCRVDSEGVHPWPIAPVSTEMLGLMTPVKAAERLIIAAATEGSRELAWRAFAAHPLVDSVTVAKQLVEGYCARIPELDRLLR